MNRLIHILLFISLVAGSMTAQTPNAKHCIYFIGNLADIEDKQSFGNHLYQLVEQNQYARAIVFNGDFVNPERSFRDEVESIHDLLEILTDLPIRIIFIPGDRDWDNCGLNGFEMVGLVEDFVNNGEFLNVEWPLQNGCPGPELITISEDLRIVAMNTQWWNHKYKKPTPESAICNIASNEAFLEEIEALVEDNILGNLIIAGHHPLISNGKYGGRFPLRDYLLPVPIISGFKTAFKQNIGKDVHTVNERYAPHKENMLDLLADHFSLVYVSGHEKNVEILKNGFNCLINSGAPVSGDFVKHTNNTLFASASPHIVSIYYDSDGAVYSLTHPYSEAGYEAGILSPIFQAPCQIPEPNIPINDRLVPCADEAQTLALMVNQYEPMREVVANPNYKANKFKQFFLGQHYRDSWTVPVQAPVLNLDQEYGGLRPYQVGGGTETYSLKFTTDAGLEYAFRSIDKDPSKGLAVKLRSTLLSVVLKDQTTTQQPYGALIISKLLDETNILHARPKLFVMPDDPKLGPFQDMFGNVVGYLEERPVKNRQGGENVFAADEMKRSIQMFRELYQDVDNTIAIDEYLLARMFDIWVGDWSRHEDNWKWAGYENEEGVYYRPIPRDRDHVFSLWDGLFPWLADREWAKDAGESFEEEIRDIRSLTYQSRHMDRFLANEMSKNDWVSAARKIQRIFNDENIATAMKELPREVYLLDGKEIERKLKLRLKDLQTYAAKYYSILAKEVDVVGSVEDELFEVHRNLDGSVTVVVFKLTRGEKDGEIFRRRFYQNETEEIRLFGLLGDDRFYVEGKVRKSIKVRVIPGNGEDYIQDDSQVEIGSPKTIIYDNENVDPVIPGPETIFSQTKKPEAYRYRRTAFQYNSYYPLSFLYFTGDNGLTVKAGIDFTNYNYEKPKFQSNHRLDVAISTIGNFEVEYQGRWRHVLNRWDLIAGAKYEKLGRFRFFFGEGNDSSFDRDLLRSGFYTLRNKRASINVGLMNEFWKRSHVFIGTSFTHNTAQDNQNTIIDSETENVLGRDPLDIGKVHFEVDLDFRDREVLPRRGMRFYTSHFLGHLINLESATYSFNMAELQYFGTAKPITLGMQAGFAIHGGKFPYYDRMYIGQNNHLRGFRRNRYTGEKLLYFNSDLRFELINKYDALIPFQLGLKLFFDAGKVIDDESLSNVWHQGYGAGFYFVPVKEKYVFNFMFGFSEEESGLFILSVGKDF